MNRGYVILLAFAIVVLIALAMLVGAIFLARNGHWFFATLLGVVLALGVIFVWFITTHLVVD